MNNKIIVLSLFILGLSLANAETLIAKSFVDDDFNSLEGWTALNVKGGEGNIVQNCAKFRIIGGYDKFGVKATMVKNFILPPHYSARITLNFLKIDSWDNEQFLVYADDELLYEKRFQVGEGEDLCGRSGVAAWKEKLERLDLKVQHNNPSVSVVFTSTVNQDANDESWGLWGFQLFVNKCPDGCDACKSEDKDECLPWKLFKWTWTRQNDVSAEGWYVEGAKREASYECAGVTMFGGADRFGKGALVSRRFKMPGHYRIKVKLTFIKMDSWDNEIAYIQVDGKNIWERKLHYSNDGYHHPICGMTGHKDLFIGVEAEGGHSDDELDIKISSTLNEDANNESWGVRDFFLFYTSCAKACSECSGPTENDCLKCHDNWAVVEGKCQPMMNFILVEESFWGKRFIGINGWTLQDNKAKQTVSECNGKSLVGGYDIFGRQARATKAFNLPDHSRVRLITTFYKIDSWDNEWLFAEVDGTKVWQRQFAVQSGGVNLCGSKNNNWNEQIVEIDEVFHHDSEEARISFSATINEDANNESWGFREFKFFYEAKQECAFFYTECDFKGIEFRFCGRSPNFREDSIPPTIRSIKIPPQGRVTLYEKNDFEGKKVVYIESVKCIEDYDLQMSQMSLDVDNENNWVQVDDSNLRKTL